MRLHRLPGTHSLARLSVLTLGLVLCSGCGATRKVAFSSEPAGAMVQIDGRNIGETPLTHSLDFTEKPRIVVSAAKAGYHPETLSLDVKARAVSKGHINLVLLEDAAWRVTTTSDATNAWMRVQVDPGLEEADVWQKLIDSVTSRYANLEQLDDKSGYIRTVSETRYFQGLSGKYQVSTRFIGSLSSRTPLIYKFKIEAQTTDRYGNWVPYDRVFIEDARLVEEIQDRLGLK